MHFKLFDRLGGGQSEAPVGCGELGIDELNNSDTPISALEEELFLQALNDCFTLKWTCLGAHNQLHETLWNQATH